MKQNKFFCFPDIKVNITMRFSSNNNLELYWKDEQGNKRNIIENVNTIGSLVTYSGTIDVNASSNVSKKKNEI